VVITYEMIQGFFSGVVFTSLLFFCLIISGKTK